MVRPLRFEVFAVLLRWKAGEIDRWRESVWFWAFGAAMRFFSVERPVTVIATSSPGRR